MSFLFSFLGSVNLTTKVAGTLPIANGGTGGSTANAALNSLGLYFGTATFNGTSVTVDSVSGLKSSSKIFVTFSANDGNDIYIYWDLDATPNQNGNRWRNATNPSVRENK